MANRNSPKLKLNSDNFLETKNLHSLLCSLNRNIIQKLTQDRKTFRKYLRGKQLQVYFSFPSMDCGKQTIKSRNKPNISRNDFSEQRQGTSQKYPAKCFIKLVTGLKLNLVSSLIKTLQQLQINQLASINFQDLRFITDSHQQLQFLFNNTLNHFQDCFNLTDLTETCEIFYGKIQIIFSHYKISARNSGSKYISSIQKFGYKICCFFKTFLRQLKFLKGKIEISQETADDIEMQRKINLYETQYSKTLLAQLAREVFEIQENKEIICQNCEQKIKISRLESHLSSCNTDSQKELIDNLQNTSMKDFKIIKRLARGQFGEVYLVQKLTTGVKYTMKKIRITSELDNLRNQKNAFQRVKGQFSIKALFSFTSQNFHYFVIEYASNGDLSDKLREQQRFYEDEAKPLLAQIAVGIHNLHEVGVIHRDIKPHNVVIDSQGHLKIIDYGLSEIHNLNNQQNTDNTDTERQNVSENQKICKIVGSPYYMSPEILNLDETNEMVDWWSYGILVYQILVGVPPFVGKSFKQIAQKINQGDIWQSDIVFGDSDSMISFRAKSLIEGLLSPNPKNRLGQSFSQIQSHQFFKGIQWNNLRNIQSTLVFNKDEQRVSQSMISSPISTQQLQTDYTSIDIGLNFIRRDHLIKETKLSYYKQRVKSYRLNKAILTLQNTLRI